MKIYIQLLVNEMVSYGIDGFALDLEGDTYANLEQNATDRQAFTDFLVELKAAMTAAGAVRLAPSPSTSRNRLGMRVRGKCFCGSFSHV